MNGLVTHCEQPVISLLVSQANKRASGVAASREKRGRQPEEK